MQNTQIIFTAQRQHLSVLNTNFFPYCQLWLTTQQKNLGNLHNTSAEMLQIKIIESILSELKNYCLKRIYVTTKGNIKVSLTIAQAITLYRFLLIIPIQPTEIYLQNVRNFYIEILDKQLF